MITVAKFQASTGQEPRQDDLQRCNCPEAGQAGHWYCGWCTRCDKPRFVCGHINMKEKA